MPKKHSARRRWIEAFVAAGAAGCSGLLALDEHARWERHLLAFFGPALAALAVQLRSEQRDAAKPVAA